jgi:hypothetical protein
MPQMKKPFGVTLISYFYIFGAIVLLFTAFFYDADANQIGIGERFGVPNAPEHLLRFIVALFSLIMIYGYFRLKKWGFWVMSAYSVMFGIISSLQLTDQSPQPYTGNLVFSILVIAYTIYVRKAFFKDEDVPGGHVQRTL